MGVMVDFAGGNARFVLFIMFLHNCCSVLIKNEVLGESCVTETLKASCILHSVLLTSYSSVINTFNNKSQKLYLITIFQLIFFINS